MNKKNSVFILVGWLVFMQMPFANKLYSQNIKPFDYSIPETRSIKWNPESGFAEHVYTSFANRPISEDNLSGKGNAPRILLAKLLSNQDIPNANRLILKLTAWGISGTTWAMNKMGDYDFSITPLTTLLYLFGDKPELLYPNTRNYLLNKLLIEEGNSFRTKAPKSFGLIPETENHILMTEGSRYLKNRWLMLHGSKDEKFDNIKNGMESKLINFIKQIEKKGLYEFNSIPYNGYTITALLNLDAFGSYNVKIEARKTLDYINWTYALGSYRLKHYPPMRRRYEKSVITGLETDYQTSFFKAWLSYYPAKQGLMYANWEGDVHSLLGACLPYRPADRVVQLLFDKGNGYFVKLGHGKNSCPEIFNAGKHYLLSAGGANQGEWSQIIARPICLFLNDTTSDLSQVIHLAGPGINFKKWNNTGVYKNFACAAGPVFIPKSFTPVATKSNWSLFVVNNGIIVAVYSTNTLGLLAVFEDQKPTELLNKIVEANMDENLLKTQFQFPEGKKIKYDVNSNKNKWVIGNVDNVQQERSFNRWQLINEN